MSEIWRQTGRDPCHLNYPTDEDFAKVCPIYFSKSKKQGVTSSVYVGVYKTRNGKFWQARRTHEQRVYGNEKQCYRLEIEAAIQSDELVRKYSLLALELNFPTVVIFCFINFLQKLPVELCKISHQRKEIVISKCAVPLTKIYEKVSSLVFVWRFFFRGT